MPRRSQIASIYYYCAFAFGHCIRLLVSADSLALSVLAPFVAVCGVFDIIKEEHSEERQKREDDDK